MNPILENCSLAIVCNNACNNPVQQAQAESLAESLQLPLLQGSPAELTNPPQVLIFDDAGVSLQATGRKAAGPVSVDFSHGSSDHRRKFGGGKGQMIAKAVGLKGKFRPHVLDATAGLGGDAFVLASLGCSMTLLERSPIVHTLLADGLQRGRDWAAGHDHELSAILMAMQLINDDSLSYLVNLADADKEQRPDVIYLDPMFPERSKSAKVKKAMVAFHSVVGADEDADGLLELALAGARYRVVVKRPAKAPFLAERTPSYQLQGKSSRFDIYTLKKLPD